MSRRLLLVVLLSLGNAPWAEAEPLEPGYEVIVPQSLSLVQDVETTLSVTIRVSSGMHIDDNGPLQLRLSASKDSGLSFKKAQLGRKDAGGTTRTRPRFAAHLRASKAGRSELRLRLRLWLCKASVCRPELVERTVQVDSVAAPVKQADRTDSTCAESRVPTMTTARRSGQMIRRAASLISEAVTDSNCSARAESDGGR